MSSGEIAQRKTALREQLRTTAARFSPADRTEASAQLCRGLRQQSPWEQARAILFFVPRTDEPDVWPLLLEALASQKKVILPRHAGPEEGYVACEVRDLETELKPGRYGIPEPAASCSRFDLKQLDLTLVPGIAFSFNGARLGRGKGYYDRLLTQISGVSCGAAFDWQIVAAIPMEPHDTRLNYIVTPSRWHQVISKPRS